MDILAQFEAAWTPQDLASVHTLEAPSLFHSVPAPLEGTAAAADYQSCEATPERPSPNTTTTTKKEQKRCWVGCLDLGINGTHCKSKYCITFGTKHRMSVADPNTAKAAKAPALPAKDTG